MSGLPPLTDEGDFWEGLDAFPLWPGTPHEVIVSVVLPEKRTTQGPSPEQANAYASFRANEVAVRDAALDALLAHARDLDEAFELPKNLTPKALRGMVEFQSVNVLPVVRDGLAYLGLGFWCAWDEEHGAGVMTHAGRMVEAGTADTSFLEWIAERDGGVWLPLTQEALLHDHLVRLLIASALSLMVGGALAARPVHRPFGLMTVAWGAIDAIVALAGLRGGPPGSGVLPFIAFNEGLDAGYVGVGLAMVLLAGERKKIKGFGLAVAIQGALLLVLDAKLWSDLSRATLFR